MWYIFRYVYCGIRNVLHLGWCCLQRDFFWFEHGVIIIWNYDFLRKCTTKHDVFTCASSYPGYVTYCNIAEGDVKRYKTIFLAYLPNNIEMLYHNAQCYRIVHTSSLKHIIPRTGVVMWVWALQIPIKRQTNKRLHSVRLAVFAYQMEKNE